MGEERVNYYPTPDLLKELAGFPLYIPLTGA